MFTLSLFTQKKTQLAGFLTLALLAALLLGVVDYYAHLEERLSQHEALVIGQNRFVPGSQSAVRVLVRNTRDLSPLPGAQVAVSILMPGQAMPTPLYTGETGPQGTVDLAFTVPSVSGSAPAPGPAGASATLVVETSSMLGSSYHEQAVKLEQEARLLLTTDKPIYQPGQAIHLRVLALGAFNLRPLAGQTVEVVIADGNGNKVFRQSAPTSDFGVTSFDFSLAEEVNTGAYAITASLGETRAGRTVMVEHYALPRFSARLASERSFYAPGQPVHASLEALYFYGKPVAHAAVHIEGFTFDVDRNQTLSLEGETDAQGRFDFEFDLPPYLAGTDADQGLARFYLEARVTDQAGHSEMRSLSLPVSTEPLLISAVPESGEFRPGVENILYVLTSYPDGSPAQASLAINGQSAGQTGPEGLGELRITPDAKWERFSIGANDAQGNYAERHFHLRLDWSEPTVLLRPDRPLYRVGDRMELAVFTSQPQATVYLDLVRERQTLSTHTVDVKGSRGQIAIDLTPDLFGLLELHACTFEPQGEIICDTRLVVVEDSNALDLALTPGQPLYRPGETAELQVAVKGQDGQGVPAAVGLAVVDEAVFSVAEQDPGFARLYFLLRSELLEPRLELHGFSVPELLSPEHPTRDTDGLSLLTNSLVLQRAAFAALAQAIPTQGLYNLYANSHAEAILQAQEISQSFFNRIGLLMAGPAALLGVLMVILSCVSLYRRRLFASSLVLSLVGFFLIWVLIGSLLFSRWGLVILFFAGLAGLFGLIGLLEHTFRTRDHPLIWMFVLAPFYLVVIFVMLAGPFNSPLHRSFEAVMAVAFLSLLLVLAAFGMQIIALILTKLRPPAPPLTPLLSLILVICLLTGCGAQATPAPAPQPTQNPLFEVAADQQAPAVEGGPAAPRLRQFFPETLLWLPNALTGENGRLQVDVPLADSITTWRVTALASTRDGRLGSATTGLRVFQDFFIDLDLPTALTVGDIVSLPVGVFNYLPEPQTVRLEVAPLDWFELLDTEVKEIEIAANDITVVYFRVRVVEFGRQPFQVTAYGSQMSDAVRKEVRVFPNGKLIPFSRSDVLRPGQPVRQAIPVPPEAISGTLTLGVKVYPGAIGQVVEGLDSLLAMPHGCFEQTSSTTYPNVLVLDYLKTSGQISPEVQLKAEHYINAGYQRLLTFEVRRSGGFSLFGASPANRMLTAYGLQEFADMQRIYPVDPELLQRIADYLFAEQMEDGSWPVEKGQTSRLPATAHLTWSLVQAGFVQDPRTQAGLDFIRTHIQVVEDPYVLALAANALVSAELEGAAGREVSPGTVDLLGRLARAAVSDGEAAYWSTQTKTFMGSAGPVASIETTALAAQALLRAGKWIDVANAALVYLVRQKDNIGNWYSTQTTVQTLKALLASVQVGSQQTEAEVTVRLNGVQEHRLQIGPQNAGVVQQVSFSELGPAAEAENEVEIVMEGEGGLAYQITGSYYLPWDQLAAAPEGALSTENIRIQLAYDRTSLAVDDTVQVNVRVDLLEGQAQSALIDLGLPPGFILLREDLDALVAAFQANPPSGSAPSIARYELAGRQLLIYVQNLQAGQPLAFSYRLQAKFPLVAQVPAGRAYDYYNPGVNGEVAPQVLTVNP